MAKKNKVAEDFTALDDAALSERILDEEVRLKKMRFSHAVNPIENPLSIRMLRRTIAQLKTNQRRRALGN